MSAKKPFKEVIIELEHGDTPISKMEYGKAIAVVVHGNNCVRKYEARYCQQCLQLILAKYLQSKDRGYRLISTQAHNESKFCARTKDKFCLGNFRVAVMKAAKPWVGAAIYNSEHKKPEPVKKTHRWLQATPQQESRMSNYLISLGRVG